MSNKRRDYSEMIFHLFDSDLGKEVLERWAEQTYKLMYVDTDPQSLAYHRGMADFVLSLEVAIKHYRENNG